MFSSVGSPSGIVKCKQRCGVEKFSSVSTCYPEVVNKVRTTRESKLKMLRIDLKRPKCNGCKMDPEKRMMVRI